MKDQDFRPRESLNVGLSAGRRRFRLESPSTSFAPCTEAGLRGLQPAMKPQGKKLHHIENRQQTSYITHIITIYLLSSEHILSHLLSLSLLLSRSLILCHLISFYMPFACLKGKLKRLRWESALYERLSGSIEGTLPLALLAALTCLGCRP